MFNVSRKDKIHRAPENEASAWESLPSCLLARVGHLPTAPFLCIDRAAPHWDNGTSDCPRHSPTLSLPHLSDTPLTMFLHSSIPSYSLPRNAKTTKSHFLQMPGTL